MVRITFIFFTSAHPKISPREIVRIFKSITTREIFRRHPEIKKELWGGEFWSDVYYVATVGERGNWSKVEKHIHEPPPLYRTPK